MAEPRNDAEGARYMPEQLSLRGIAIGALSIAAAIAFAVAAAYAAVHLSTEGAPPRLAAHHGKPPPIAGGTELEVDPADQMRAFVAAKRELLDSYGWVDRERGVARIPIERAMELVARTGAETAPK
jgi:hypothetical protein